MYRNLQQEWMMHSLRCLMKAAHDRMYAHAQVEQTSSDSIAQELMASKQC